MKIGIDFDNTLACYDATFIRLAREMGLPVDSAVTSKRGVKPLVQASRDGELAWQRMQGQVYGRLMQGAALFPGVMEFLQLARQRGHEVVIVSHKTEFGHFDDRQVSLRQAALQWLQAQGFFEPARGGLRPQQVYFESTRADKARRIADLGCTHFIDDLAEVFEEPLFPLAARKVLFQPDGADCSQFGLTVMASWRGISQALLGDWTADEVTQVLQEVFPDLAISQATLLAGRGNSRVYRLSSSGQARQYALKIYPDRQLDARPRLETERTACQLLSASRYPVPAPVASDPQLGWGVFEWVEALPASPVSPAFVTQSLAFVKRLYRDRTAWRQNSQIPAASEACLSGAELLHQIQQRLGRLTLGAAPQDATLATFLTDDFGPVLAHAADQARQKFGDTFGLALPPCWQCPSPSDFGHHNALQASDGRWHFIDFEYFGWDDPVKLVADAYWHPGMGLGPELQEQWLTACRDLFADDPGFAERLAAYLPLHGLKWCLVLLNAYLPLGVAQRSHAQANPAQNLSDYKADQLLRARVLLDHIKDMTHEFTTALESA
jgi:Phosphotransferase enzyme family